MTTNLKKILQTKVDSPLVFGMVHIAALPGTPFNSLTMKQIVNIAIDEALLYKKAGFDGIVIENMHDRPYLKYRVGDEITAAMARVAVEIRQKVGNDFPIGIQILAGANVQALSVAHVAELDFIRAEGCVFAHIADEGFIESSIGELMRERRKIGADEVLIWTDIKKKHSSHAITADLSIEDWIDAAELFNLDGIILTGASTGKPASTNELVVAKKTTKLPVIIGSGITANNLSDYWAANALIVGSSLKYDSNWGNPIDPDRLTSFMAQVEDLRRLPV